MATSQSRFETGERAPAPNYEGQLGDGERQPTVIESDGDEERCPYCGNWYSLIGSHWSQSSCEYPPISRYKMELLKGMMLGDGSLDMSCKNPHFAMQMTNVTFLHWLQRELGWLSGEMSRKMTASETAQSARDNLGSQSSSQDCLDCYRFRTCNHPLFTRFASWYETGSIRFPTDLTLTGISLRMWYVSDGCLDIGEGRVEFGSLNESNRPQAIISMLSDCGFTVYQSGIHFRLPVDETEDFFDYIGHDPVPGFEYKWAYEDRDRYERLKKQCREQHCTQTLE